MEKNEITINLKLGYDRVQGFKGSGSTKVQGVHYRKLL